MNSRDHCNPNGSESQRERFELMDADDEITSVRIAYSNFPPFVDIKEENGREVIDGIMPPIIRGLLQWMKLNVSWVRQYNNEYGIWNGTTFTGMVGMLYRNEADLIMNPILPDSDIFEVADYTNAISYGALTMLSGKETQGGGLFLYFSVLQPSVWSAIGISLIVIACASGILFLRASDGIHSSLLAVFEYIWVYTAYMLRQAPTGKGMLRKKKSLVAVLMTFLLVMWQIGVAFLIMNLFQSRLVSKLTIVKKIPVVDTLEEFVSKKNVIGLTPREINMQTVLKGSNIAVYEKTWEKLEPELLDAARVFTDKSFKEVENGNVCLFHGHFVLKKKISDYFQKKGRCNFHLSNNYFFPFPLLIALKKTLPQKFREQFNSGVTRLVDADISGKWFKPTLQMSYFCTSYSETDLKPLNLNNILGVLVIWGIGMTSATICIIIENIYFNSQLKKRNRN